MVEKVNQIHDFSLLLHSECFIFSNGSEAFRITEMKRTTLFSFLKLYITFIHPIFKDSRYFELTRAFIGPIKETLHEKIDLYSSIFINQYPPRRRAGQLPYKMKNGVSFITDVY